MKPHSLIPLLALPLVFLSAARGEDAAKSEAAEVPPSVLKRFDRNKNGALDEPERAKWEAEKNERREKYRAERAAMLEKYDADRDGRISEAEKADAKLGWQRERTVKEAERMKERAEREKAKAEEARREAEKKPGVAEESASEPMMMAE